MKPPPGETTIGSTWPPSSCTFFGMPSSFPAHARRPAGASPKVSVIVPFRNSAATLGPALDSIAASTHANLEVLLIDDGGTDRSGALAEAFARRDPRFRYFRNSGNRQVSFSRNRGLDEAGGDYILFVDSDDRISADWIRNLLDDAAATGAEIVIGKAKRLLGGEARDYAMKGLARRGALRFETLVFKDNGVVWNKLYSAALLKRHRLRFEESLCIGEDLLFNFRALERARGIFYGDRGFYFYRADNDSSIMRGSRPEERVANLSGLLRILVRISREMDKQNPSVLRNVARDILMNHYRHLGGPPERATLDLIRTIDRFLPFKVRFSVWRKTVRRRLSSRIS